MKRIILALCALALALPAAAQIVVSGTLTTKDASGNVTSSSDVTLSFPRIQFDVADNVSQSPTQVTPGTSTVYHGSIYTVGANGEVYQDAVRLTSGTQLTTVSKLVLYGQGIYGQGKTDATKWWKWDPFQKGWIGLADFDGNVLK